MTIDLIMRIVSEALVLTLILSALPVLTAMAIGLLVSVAQAATQVQEQTLSVVPKIVAVYLAILFGGAWMIRELVRFAISLYSLIG